MDHQGDLNDDFYRCILQKSEMAKNWPSNGAQRQDIMPF